MRLSWDAGLVFVVAAAGVFTGLVAGVAAGLKTTKMMVCEMGRRDERLIVLVRDVLAGSLKFDADGLNDGADGLISTPDLVPKLTVPPPVDPTDGIVPDRTSTGFGLPDGGPSPVGLSDLYPNVDPWLIGEPELPEMISDAELHPDEPQVMTGDGNWVPLSEAARPVSPDDRPGGGTGDGSGSRTGREQ